MEPKDKLLYQQLKSGDEQAFNRVFDQYYIQLCLFSSKIIKDIDKSRSIVQDVFVDLWVDHQRLNITNSLRSYLYTAVKNLSLDYLKHLKVESEYVSSFVGSNVFLNDTAIEEAELNQKINIAIENLPPQCKAVFKLSRLEGLKYSEISERLNISVKTVEMHVGTALKKLRKELSDFKSH